MTQASDIKLTAEQEEYIIKTILDFVDIKGTIPSSDQLSKNITNINRQKIVHFIKKIDTKRYENPKYEKLMQIRKKYISKKINKDNWKFSEFYNWFIKSEKCHYCGITQSELHDLFDVNEKFDKKDRPIKSKKFGATLHIERLNSDGIYCKENCVLACAVCNNAKSDLISENDFKECFVSAIQKFYSILKSRFKHASKHYKFNYN